MNPRLGSRLYDFRPVLRLCRLWLATLSRLSDSRLSR
nr:MAG TPA: hypothetical protein [Caudoviricetes sp.]